jgi:hypothetical protein
MAPYVGAVVAEQEGDGGGELRRGGGTVACISGPRRSAASWDPQLATMLVIAGPGAATLNRRLLGPYITAELGQADDGMLGRGVGSACGGTAQAQKSTRFPPRRDDSLGTRCRVDQKC